MSLGILGFALSVVALLWNLAVTWLKWPRIRVEIFPIVGAAETYRLIIVNLGSEAITLRSIGLGTRTSPHALDYATDRFRGGPLPEGADLPARIEGHDLRMWTYNEELLRCSQGEQWLSDTPTGTRHLAGHLARLERCSKRLGQNRSSEIGGSSRRAQPNH